MKFELPTPSLVVLVGPSGCGKSTFAAKHFRPTEVVSSDVCRGLVSDDENAQDISKHAFELLHTIVSKRLELGRVAVVDATNVQREDRRSLLQLAREHDLFAVAVVFNLPKQLCQDRNRNRPDRDFGPHVVSAHHRAMRQSLRGLRREGFRHVLTLRSPDEVDAVAVARGRLWTDRREAPDTHPRCGREFPECREKLLYL
ncbi:MAG: AAA family ATPase [Planctomycetota bacterium]